MRTSENAPAVRARERKPDLKIDLFLDKINQEMIRTTPPRLAAGCDFYVTWTKSCCVLDFARVRPGEELVNPRALRGFLLRKEPEGGMMWNPSTGAVYKLSEDAYHALIDLDHNLSKLEVARRNRFTLKDVAALERRLRRIQA